jgi:hypothetical protein
MLLFQKALYSLNSIGDILVDVTIDDQLCAGDLPHSRRRPALFKF